MPRSASRSGPALLASLSLAVLGPFSVRAAAAAAWEVYTNANRLTGVAAVGPNVWAPSAFGLHRFDPVTGAFTRILREPGTLRSNSITVVTPDTSGTLWIGTNDQGVSLLGKNGRWSSISRIDGLHSDHVNAIVPYQDGMWIATDRGLSFFVGTTIEAAYPDGVNPTPFRSDDIRDVVTFGGRTWVATTGGVHSIANGVDWDTTIAGLASRDVRSLAHDGTRLWAVTADHRVYVGGESGAWSSGEAGLPGPIANRVRYLGGRLYLATSDGICRWETATSSWTSIGGPSSIDLDRAADGTLWAAGDGLWRDDGSSWRQFRSAGPAGNWMLGMALQGSTVYIATRDGGVARHDDARGWRSFLGKSDPDTSLLEGNYVFACLVDRNGYKWLGDWGDAISRLDDSSEPPRFQHFCRDTVRYTFGWAAAQDPRGPVWFGLDTGCRGCGPGSEPLGLIEIGPDSACTNFQPANSGMTNRQGRAIAFAPDGTMWVGYADGGVDLFAAGSLADTIRHLGMPNGLRSENVWGIAFDGSSALVLTDGGVARYLANGAQVQLTQTFSTPGMSANGAVTPIAIDGQGGVWVASKAGLYHRPSGAPPEIFNVSNSPLVSDDVHSVVVDRATGDVWIATGEGANRLRPSQLGGTVRPTSTRIDFSPNPIRMSGGMRFVVRSSAGDLVVRTQIEVIDVTGHLRARLRTDGDGEVFWGGETENGHALVTGVYFLRAVTVRGDGRRDTLAKGRLVILP